MAISFGILGGSALPAWFASTSRTVDPAGRRPAVMYRIDDA